MSSRARLVLLGLALAGGAYFAFTSPLGIEYIDEGQIVYPIWAVAEGAIPYREFRQLYGPALFFLNGGVMRWLGEDLMWIRLVLCLVKAAVGVIVYLLARSVAAPPFALLAWAWFVATWGTPLVFNTPYANHYALALGLLGLLAFLSWRSRFALACTLAGLCFGAAATFKQTTGVFELVSFLLFLAVRPASESASRPSAFPQRVPVRLVRAIGLAIPVFTLALFTAYLWPRNTARNFLVIATLPAALAGAALVRALRSDPQRRGSLALGALCAGAGGAVAPLAFAAFYATHGLLAELLFNTVRGLPEVMRWFVPLNFPHGRTLLAVAALACCFAALGVVRRRAAAFALAGAATVAAAVFLHGAGARGGLSAYFFARGWYGDVIRLWLALPFAVVGLTAALLRPRPGGSNEKGNPAASRREALLLLACHGTVSLLYLYPAGDLWHVVMILPSFLPLIAHLVERYVGSGGEPAGARLGKLALVVATIALLAAPSLQLLSDARRAGSGARLRRASGISGADPQFGQVAELLDNLEERRPAGAMLVTTGESMLYFLAGRRSVVERDEFVLYLVAVDLISEEDARALVDESRVVERLAALQPLVIDRERSPAAKRFRRVFANVARYIDSHYRVAAAFGGYRVLEWKG